MLDEEDPALALAERQFVGAGEELEGDEPEAEAGLDTGTTTTGTRGRLREALAGLDETIQKQRDLLETRFDDAGRQPQAPPTATTTPPRRSTTPASAGPADAGQTTPGGDMADDPFAALAEHYRQKEAREAEEAERRRREETNKRYVVTKMAEEAGMHVVRGIDDLASLSGEPPSTPTPAPTATPPASPVDPDATATMSAAVPDEPQVKVINRAGEVKNISESKYDEDPSLYGKVDEDAGLVIFPGNVRKDLADYKDKPEECRKALKLSSASGGGWLSKLAPKRER